MRLGLFDIPARVQPHLCAFNMKTAGARSGATGCTQGYRRIPKLPKSGHVLNVPFLPSSFPFDTAHTPAVKKMLFTRLSLVAFASALVSTVAGELSITSPGGSALWWGKSLPFVH